MSNRKALVGAAACAVLALTSLVRADSSPRADGAAKAYPSELTLSRPVYLQDETPTRTPLMAILNRAGLAQPLEDAGITFGGRVEGSWTYSASAPPANVITGRVFDFENQDITLNQVGLVVDKQIKTDGFDIGGRIEWIYGADSRLIHSVGLFDHYGASPDNQWDLNQAYVDVGFGGGLKVRLGKFVALHGYEVIDPTGNALFSHSFMFGYAIPFTHTGALISAPLGETMTITAGITRGWDTSLEDNNDTIDILGQLTSKMDDKTNLILNVVSGADQPGDNDNWRTVVDLIVTHQFTENVSMALNIDYGYEVNSLSSVSGSDAQWFGIAGYTTSKISDEMSITLRAEYFNDQDGARLTGGVGGCSVYEATLGMAIKPFANDALGQGLVIRPEIRFDYAEEAFFDGGTDHYQVTAAIDAYFKF